MMDSEMQEAIFGNAVDLFGCVCDPMYFAVVDPYAERVEDAIQGILWSANGNVILLHDDPSLNYVMVRFWQEMGEWEAAIDLVVGESYYVIVHDARTDAQERSWQP